jgi:hypothetical protein
MKTIIENNKISVIIDYECTLDDILDIVDKFDSKEWDDYDLVFRGETPLYSNYGFYNSGTAGFGTTPGCGTVTCTTIKTNNIEKK